MKKQKKNTKKESAGIGEVYVVMDGNGRLASLECYDPTTALKLAFSLNAALYDLDDSDYWEKCYHIQRIPRVEDISGIELDDGDRFWHSVQE